MCFVYLSSYDSIKKLSVYVQINEKYKKANNLNKENKEKHEVKN